jgi:hypothetical protein
MATESLGIDRQEFQNVWLRTEAPVAEGEVTRSWLWGPEPRSNGLEERYLNSPGQNRTVQYFDKGRMEINDPDANPGDPWYVTSGLLTRELISGQIQIGDTTFMDTGEGAAIHVAGDPQSPFPHYRHLADIIDIGQDDRTGERADAILTPLGIRNDGAVPDDAAAEFVEYVVYHGPMGEDVGYNIPRSFWDYLNAPGIVYEQDGSLAEAEPLFFWIYVMGLPIADPFWVEVAVDGVKQWVLVQPFERRVLTYTPKNPDGWQVEMGNIGQHYRDWRNQFFDPARGDADMDFYGLAPGETWRFRTSHSVDETWNTTGVDDSFVPGSTLYAREEFKLEGRRTTFWSADESGVYLHGWEVRDGQGIIRSMVSYAPAIHVLPSAFEEQILVTNVTAISMLHDRIDMRVEVTVDTKQLVSTPAGIFQTWRLESTPLPERGMDHRLGTTFWFEPEIGVVQWLDNGFSANLISSSTLED